MTRETATLERHAVYTFQARWTESWRSGRLLLAGDAAHLMPPFAGQGMCSGIRDAANLAWKLDLVLAGVATPALLDTYTAERRAHVQHAIGMSAELGKVICVMDADAAAQRDAFMTGQGGDPAKILPPLPPPMLTDGLLHRGPDGSPVPGAGLLSPQPRLQLDGRTGLVDDVIGHGFVVAAAFDPAAALRSNQREFLRSVGTHLVHLGGEVHDVDGTFLPYLGSHGATAVIRRPDHYIFSMAADADELVTQVDDLHRQLTATSHRAPGEETTDE
jgi:flavoprotein hydroxylase